MFKIPMMEFPKNTKKIFDLSFNFQRCYDDLKDVTIGNGGRSKVCLSAIFLENLLNIFSDISRSTWPVGSKLSRAPSARVFTFLFILLSAI